MLSETWAIVFLAVIGAAMGSFAGATTWRLKNHKDMVKDRSECEHCHHKLSAADLVPIVSWLVLRGRCRYCRKPIGWTPLFFEVGVAAVFVLSYLFWPGGLNGGLELAGFVLWLLAVVGLAILFAYDLKWYILPYAVLFPLIAIGLAFFVLQAIAFSWTMPHALVELVVSLLPVAGLYGLLFFVSRGRWVGDSDPILGVFIGLVLGWQSAILVVFLANFIALIAILPKLASKRLGAKDQVPFGPFLIIATIVAFWFGHDIINWYFSLLLV